MDDQTLETLSMRMKLLNLASDQTPEVSKCDSDQVEHDAELLDESTVSSDSQEVCSAQEQTLPILCKFEDLSNRVVNLRKEHMALCNEVKCFTMDSFPGAEVSNALKKYDEECQALKKKYLTECLERKRLYNEVIELKGNIRVFCRCRPLNQDEMAKRSSSVVDFESGQENELQIVGPDSNKKLFKLDHVFGPDANQETVFQQTLPLVTSVLDGYNVCIFAYGQTGTGKTFTMEGTPESRGVNYRTLEQLFQIADDRKGIMKYELFVSMLEVYNEKIRDLLVENSDQPSKRLEIKQSAEGTQEVPGLVQAQVYGTTEVWELLKCGSRVRSVGSTNANELSSRSHCLLRVTVIGENLVNGQRTRSHLWLVDLAGSERVGKIEVEGERLKESQFINKSLSALGDVISALASKTAHIPYRNSKLTHILQSSLGGDCKTLMFVQISPSAADLGETLCSLNFASRVRGVEHGPARKQADTGELFKNKQLAEKAKQDEKEIKRLQDSVQGLQLRISARERICRSLQEKVRDLENQLAEERKTRQKQENRALAAVSAHSSLGPSSLRPGLSTISEKKPPLPSAPTKLRLPLRRITNFLPQPSPVGGQKQKGQAASMLPPLSSEDKENMSRMTSNAKSSTVQKARRGSFVSKPCPTLNNQQPKRRASIAAMIRPESSKADMTAPINNAWSRNNRRVGRQSFVWDPQRVWRTSRVQSPPHQMPPTVEATPVAAPKSSKFMGSPPAGQIGSWKPKHPTVIALQRKQLVWSPLKYRGSRTTANRRSLLPS